MSPPVSAPLPLVRLCLASALLAGASGASYAYVDLSLNAWGLSASAIGINAAMPALAWLLATPLMPWALRHFSPRHLLLGLLAVIAAAITCSPLFHDPGAWLVLRFLFGGSLGLVFRLVEYWINATAPEAHRARSVGLYAMSFGAGAMAGASVIPLIGVDGWPSILLMVALTGAATLIFALTGGGPPRVEGPPVRIGSRFCRHHGGLAVCAALIFGMFEAVSYTMMPVYAIRLGLPEHWAVWCAAATIGGQIVMAAPTGILADRYGKVRVMTGAATLAALIPALIPHTTHAPPLLLITMLLWGGVAGTLYTVALALLADQFRGADLAAANAAFGTLYAIGSLSGPLLHGVAMDLWPAQGLMVSAAAQFCAFLCAVLIYSRISPPLHRVQENGGG